MLDTSQIKDADIARLYSNLKLIDNGLEELRKADIFSKADKAQNVIIETRKMLSNIALTMHVIKNDIERIKNAQSSVLYSRQ